MIKQFNELLEEEIKIIYRFFVQQERELFLQINSRLHVRKRYEFFSMNQLDKELDELQKLSTHAKSLSSYIFYNITGISKILKKFDKKFKRYNYNFTKNFVVEKYKKKNSDLLYINQYKILDEIGACVEQLKDELLDQYYYLLDNPIKEENNARTEILNQNLKKEDNNIKEGEDQLNNLNNLEKNLLNNNDGHDGDNLSIKDKFTNLKKSIKEMEVYYQNTSKTFNVWMRYVKENDLKSDLTVKSAGDIRTKYESGSTNTSIIEDEEEKANNKKSEHFLSNESHWNIKLIYTQSLIMSMCATYIMPTIFYILTSNKFHTGKAKGDNLKRGFFCGLVISMSPLGGLISMGFTYCIIKKSYKWCMILSSILSLIGNSIFILGIKESSLILICVGRLITGFSLNTPVHRQYLLYFIPKRRMSKYLLYFKLYVLLGNSLGPLMSFLCLFIRGKEEIHEYFNPFSLPGWICLLTSFILLIAIVFGFSEPLDPKFRIYSKGQNPIEAMKMEDSFALNDNLTIFECDKLNEINKKISNFNDENQFNDTNLVSITIKELIEIETEPYGTVRKAFWIITFYIFITNFIINCYFTMCPFFLYVNIYKSPEKNGSKIISILYFLGLLSNLGAFLLNFYYISKRLDKILYIKIIALTVFLSELTNASLVIQSNNPIIYHFIFLATILLASVMEDQLIYFYTYIIPSNFELLGIEGLTVLHVVKYLGNILGSVSSLFGLIIYFQVKDSEGCIEWLMIYQSIFTICFQFILLIFFFLYSKRFSDRPIRRILYNKNTREIRTTEF